MDYNFKLYIPYDDINDKCAILVNNDYYYVYNINDNELSNDYDIVLFNNYFKFKGKEVNNVLVTDCYPYITNNFYYRNDLSFILLNVFIITFFGFIIPWKVITRFCKKLN